MFLPSLVFLEEQPIGRNEQSSPGAGHRYCLSRCWGHSSRTHPLPLLVLPGIDFLTCSKQGSHAYSSCERQKAQELAEPSAVIGSMYPSVSQRTYLPLTEFHGAMRRSFINKSLNQIIIDAIPAAPVPEPGQTNAPPA